MKIVHISSTGLESGAVARAAHWLRQNHIPELNLVARSRHDLFDTAAICRVVDEIATADALILIPHGGSTSIAGLEQIIAASEACAIRHVQPSSSSTDDLQLCQQYASDFGTAAYRRRLLFLKNGGVANLINLYLDLANAAGRCQIAAAEPGEVPCEGIYHPARPDVPERDSYLAWQRQRLPDYDARPIIGIWFYHTYWINGNLNAIDTLIEEIEAQNCVPLAVFHRRLPDAELGNGGAAYVVGEIFCRNGKSLIDALISPTLFSLAFAGDGMQQLLNEMDVPVLQMIITQNPAKVWRETLQAVTPQDVSMAVAQPEFDGALISTVGATHEIGDADALTGGARIETRALPERIRRIVGLAHNWARLRRTPPQQRRIAIIFHHYPPRNDRLGCAFGLDSFASVKALLDRMHAENYHLEQGYESADALAQALLSGLTSDRRFLPAAKMAERAAASIDPATAIAWHHEIGEIARQQQCRHWGEAPGTLFTHNGNTLVGGLLNGNIYIGLQPPRGQIESLAEAADQSVSSSIHDPNLPPPHHYPAVYRWIRDSFGAHAVMHIGKHGSLEWLPGKSVGLSENCFPDLAIADLPNLYPYIVNNPGEGTQAKRRSYACILDHLIPAQTTADADDALAEIETHLEHFYQATSENPSRITAIAADLWQAVSKARLDDDLKLQHDDALADPAAFAEAVHSYINEIAICSINNGLHIFGQPPQGQQFAETLAAMLRLPNDGVPSLPDAVAEAQSLDADKLRANRGAYAPQYHMTNGQLLRRCQNQSVELLKQLQQAHWQPGAIDACLEQMNLPATPALKQVLQFAATTLRQNLERTSEELDMALHGLNGGFVPPGASGAPTRGRVDVLPTGRNFYSLDPYQIPNAQAWKVGQALAMAMIERYRQQHGRDPEQVAMVLWASPTMRTRGDDVAQVLYLLGVRPIWQAITGRVLGVEVIPASERSIARFDVTVRTSGMFRDAFANVMELIDEAVRMVAALNEPPQFNLLARNVRHESAELQHQGGLGGEDAWRQATLRVFSSQPGTYGSGVNSLLEASAWTSVEDLGKAYIDWSSYAYGQGVYGCYDRAAFQRRMAVCQVTIQNQDSRESDIFSCDDYNSYHGGMNAAVRLAGGNYAMSISGDSNDPRRPAVRSTAEEGKFIFRARVLNQKWIAGMKRHGYKGAGDMSRLVDIIFQWDATSGIIEPWQYQAVAETYALDADMQDFFRQHNPDALYNITERLLEAIRRGLWENPGEFADQLQSLYLEMEGELEERL